MYSNSRASVILYVIISRVIYRGHFIDFTLDANQYFIPFQSHRKHVFVWHGS